MNRQGAKSANLERKRREEKTLREEAGQTARPDAEGYTIVENAIEPG